MKIRCPHGHRVGEVTFEGGCWMLEVVPDMSLRLVDSNTVLMSRYPEREPLNARPRRILACPRECMLEKSWYLAESAELERRAAARVSNYQLTR